MNERIRELVLQANPASKEIYESDNWEYNCAAWCAKDLAKFAELIVRECMELNRKQSWDLTGVIIDVEESTGFDEVCMNTVKRVKNYLAGDDLLKHFGVEE